MLINDVLGRKFDFDIVIRIGKEIYIYIKEINYILLMLWEIFDEICFLRFFF